MFEDSLLETRAVASQRRRTRVALAASVATQAVLCTIFFVTPLLWPENLPVISAASRMVRLTPAVIPPKPEPVKPREIRQTVAFSNASRAAARPQVELRRGNPLTARPTLALDPDALSLPAGTATMAALATGSSSPFGGGGTAVTGPTVALARPAAGPGKPIRVSAGITQGLLIAPIVAVYPNMAKITRTQGTIVISATIDKTGRIVGAQVTSGPPILRQAALDAVATARYRPFLLSGEPTEVITTITVNFVLSN